MLSLQSLCLLIQAQDNSARLAIAFYNVENLFDTINDPHVNDEDFTPDGKNQYTGKIYRERLKDIAYVISRLGMGTSGAVLVGLAEVENRQVLEDLVGQQRISGLNYQVEHFDSPDERGIDVALLYQPDDFELRFSRPLFVSLPKSDGEEDFTRDVLWVYGDLSGEPVHVFINHWPSRWGGAEKSSPLRKIAAQVCMKIIDSLTNIDPSVKIIMMGDFNDDPIDKSVKEVLKAEIEKEEVGQGEFYNPWYDLYTEGKGTSKWKGHWNLFDQILVSSSFLNSGSGLLFQGVEIFKESFLIQRFGNFKGYPYRAFAWGLYLGGYSDHLPVVMYLRK